MILSVISGRIDPEKANALVAAYQSTAARAPKQVQKAWLLRHRVDATRWQIVTLWESDEGREVTLRAGDPLAGSEMMRAAGAKPTLELYDVVVENR